MTEVIQDDSFKRDLKKLQKKYPSIDEDMKRLITVMCHIRQNEISGTKRIANLGEKYAKYPVYKVKSFRCKSLQGKGSRCGIRVIFYDDVTADKITLIQIYCKNKNKTANHDVERITNFLDQYHNLK